MASKTFAVVCAFAIFNAVNSQVLNRILPGFAPNILPVSETFLPNQVVLNSPYIQSALPNYVNYELPAGVDTILSAPVTVPATTTIIQDSTVANNLANALQLLVVSNLLSNTLPSMNDVVVPSYGYAPIDAISPLALAGFPGYNYVF